MAKTFNRKSERGVYLIETLVTIGLFGVLGLALANSLVASVRMRARADHNSVAMQLALQELERYAAIDPSTLTAANGFTAVRTQGKMSFNVTVAVAVNADTTRTVTVNATDVNTVVHGKASVSNTFPLWGSQ
jgi:type II secretory pathway pseudopilin PulG